MSAGPERVAVVGSGISGLTAAYVLQRRFEVTLFESDSRLGGHAHTHEVAGELGRTVPVDSGFIVHNERTYPRLIRLFAELGVATQETDMSMSVRCEGCGLEYAGARGPRGLFAQWGSVARPDFLRMLGEVKRFHREARRLLHEPATADGPGSWSGSGSGFGSGAGAGAGAGAGGGSDQLSDPTLGEFLHGGGYSTYFAEHFMLPLVSAVWSTGSVLARRYPARYLFRFLEHHGMLAVTGSPQWRTVVGGSRSYVERAVKGLTAVQVSTPIQAVTRGADEVRLRDASGELHTFDRVVIATHSDQALHLLTDATTAEREVLGAIGYSRNETILHTDAGLLPRARSARSSWNYLLSGCASGRGRGDRAGRRAAPERQLSGQPLLEQPAVISYDMNRLHRLDEPVDYVVTMNAAERIRPESVIARMMYEHPVYTPESVAAQARLPELNSRLTAYAGAYHGWGFHEDGCASGAAAAAAFGVVW